jgi:hypothetical protein
MERSTRFSPNLSGPAWYIVALWQTTYWRQVPVCEPAHAAYAVFA